MAILAAALGAALGAAAIAYAIYLIRWVLSRDPGTEKMREISEAIAIGAKAYLFRQYRTLAIVMAILAVAIAAATANVLAAVSFVLGALGSMLAGYLGMYVTTRSASRVAVAAAGPYLKREAANGGQVVAVEAPVEDRLGAALAISWRAGAVMGLSLTGIALLLISLLYLAYSAVTPEWALPLVALGFGASLVTLFMRVGGGIYTKAADLGADLVGKVEVGIPEDDPRNPGVIADNVGDNVGDVAGMAADVFESYIVTVTAAIFLAWIMGLPLEYIVAPILYGALAVVATLIGVLMIRGGRTRDPMASISKAIYTAIAVSVILFALGSVVLLGPTIQAAALAASASLGALMAPVILKVTDYFTSYKYGPVRRIADQARISPATVIVTGYAVGLTSAIPVLLLIAVVLGVTYALGYFTLAGLVSSEFGPFAAFLAGIYGTAIASVGLLVVAGIIITADSFGPVSDNANGVVEMTGLPDEVRQVTDILDSVGNTTKATTKGYAIASAGIAALVLFIALIFEIVKALGLERLGAALSSISIINPNLLIGALIGVAILYIFSARTLEAVGRTAMEIIEEIRRQFRERPGILEWREKPDYARVVDIATRRALGEFLIPGIIAIVVPVATGLVLGWQALVGVILGAIVAGVPRALLMANAGGAWDNAKKYLEIMGKKKTEEHKAAVIGDTVGDPFKDTTGPSINPLIKVLNTLAVVFAAAIVAANMAVGMELSGLLPYILAP